MPQSLRVALPWIWTALIGLLVILVTAASPNDLESVGDYLVVAGPILLTGLAAAIFNQRPGNRIAWLLLIAATAGLAEELSLIWIDGPPDPVTLLDVLAIATRNLGYFYLFIVPFCLLLFWFPTGKPLNRRWRWSAWVAGAVYVAGAAVWILPTELTYDGVAWSVENPIGVFPPGGLVEEAGFLVFGLGLLTLLFGGITAIVVRYRRSDPTTRSQIKLVGLTMSLWAVNILVRFQFDIQGLLLAELVDATLLILVPASITFAIVRHRLFDIDRLLSRTVAYVIVVGLLGATFAVLVAMPGLLIGGVGADGSLEEAPPFVIAAATLAVVALFNPVRRRVVAWVDRRFNRSRYNAEQIIEQFSERLRDEVNMDLMTTESLAIVNDTMHPSSIGIWVRHPN